MIIQRGTAADFTDRHSLYANNHYIVMYSARNDYNDFGIGLLVGRNMFNLHGTDLDYIYNGQADVSRLWDYLNNDL